MTPHNQLPSYAGLRILVIDDDAMVRNIIVEYLHTFGFSNIIEAKNGLTGLKHIQNRGERLDLIIADWEMPGLDGLTLLKAVRNNPFRASTRFMLVTSQSSRERFKVTQAAQSSVDAYIVKPFRGEILKQKIFEVLGLSDDSSATG